jgi:hypothetical protein
MPAATHQTVRLGPGRHTTPSGSMCVMELASILAGEEFTDTPRCADPVLGAFLRELNDKLPSDRRQELRPYAAEVVGTAGPRAVSQLRWRRCLRYASGREDGTRTRLGLLRRFGVRAALRPAAYAPAWAVATVFERKDPIIGLDLLDELLDLGRAPGPSSPAAVMPPPRRLVLERAPVAEMPISCASAEPHPTAH